MPEEYRWWEFLSRGGLTTGAGHSGFSGTPGSGFDAQLFTKEVKKAAPTPTQQPTSQQEATQSKYKPRVNRVLGPFIPEPNELDAFDQATYHFKLYLIDDESLSAQQYHKPKQTVIIAESGVTAEVSIDSVELTSFLGMHQVNKNKQTTGFKINLVESFGATLIDKIYIASRQLKIPNYTEAMFFLELSFRGRTADQSIPVQPSKKMIWPIKISGIETLVDSGGSEYSINAFLYTNLGFSSEYLGIIPAPLTLINNDTIGTAFTNLENAVNTSLLNHAGATMTFADEVMFIVDPELTDYKMTIDAPADTGKSTPKSTQSPSIIIPKHSALIDVINSIFSASPDYAKHARGTDTPDAPEDDKKLPDLKSLHRVSTFVQHIGFDPIRNTYIRRFVFLISDFKTANLISNMNEMGHNHNSQDTFNKLRQEYAVHKHYNYIYTGVNDQVIDFEMKFNFGWYVKRPVFGGRRVTNSSTAEGAEFSRFKHILIPRQRFNAVFSTQQQIFKDLYKLDPDIRRAKLGTKAGEAVTAIVDMANKAIADAETIGAKAAAIRLYLGLIDGVITTTDKGKTIINFGDNTFVEIDGTQEKAIFGNFLKKYNTEFKNKNLPDPFDSIYTSRPPTPGGPPRSFVSDQKVPKQKITLMPVTYTVTDIEENSGQNDSAVMEQDGGSGTEYVDSLFGQAFSEEGGDMVSIKVTIKGDPFWLETPPIYNTPGLFLNVTQVVDLRRKILEEFPKLKGKNNLELNGGRVSSTYKQNYIIFSVNTPVVADVHTGIAELRTEAFNGLYAVNQVVSKFENGKFTQEMTAYRTLAVTAAEIKNGKT